MTDPRFIRHRIAGSEAGQPRPLAYLRRGFGRRLARPRGRGGAWPLLMWAAVLLSGAAACGALVAGAPL